MKIFSLLLIYIALFLFSCNNQKDLTNNEEVRQDTILQMQPKIIDNLKSDYLYTDLENKKEPYILGLSFRDSILVFTFRSKSQLFDKARFLSVSFRRSYDTISIIKYGDSIYLGFLKYYQLPKEMVVDKDGALIVTKLNESVNKIKNVLYDSTVFEYEEAKTPLLKVFEKIMPTTYDNYKYYSELYAFKKDEFNYET